MRAKLIPALAAAAAMIVPLLTASPAGANPSAPAPAPPAAEGEPALRLWAPARMVAHSYFGERVPLEVRLSAEGGAFELWSHRATYDDPITTVWKKPDGTEVTLPPGLQPDFNSLRNFLRLEIVDRATGEGRTVTKDVCLNASGQRSRPDAPPTSPYPGYCFANPYSLGSVQGIQAGWTVPVMGYENPVRLARGRYDVTARITQRYARAFGLARDDASRSFRLVVKGGEEDHEHLRSGRTARAAAQAPTGAEQAVVDGPVPNLRSLPAWGMSISESGDVLRFAATVWNAGDSPLVVDGFRREGEDRMDAYQYFFDGDGNQTGYQQVGSFQYDTKDSHQHWHFKDFASYRLLNADQSLAVRSKKEAFCLANTDAVDLTVKDADWQPENTDLSTDCGEGSSQSLRQVLSAGWGDTYAQFRAGQAFRLDGLPNGKYFVATIANPRNRLVESSTADNVSLRKIFISGKPGDRKVRVPQLGLIQEPSEQW